MSRLRLTRVCLAWLLSAGALGACSKSVQGVATGDGDGDGDNGGTGGDGGDGDGDGDGDGSGGGDGDAPGDGDGDMAGDGDGDQGMGGDSNGSGGAGQSGTFSVSSVTPADAADGVARDLTSATVDFTAPVDPETVNESRVVLEGPMASVPVLVAASGDQIEVAPTEELLLLATYSLHLDSEVASQDGNALGEEFVSSFTTADGAWTPTAPVEDDEAARVGSVGPETAIAANGDMLVVYQLQGELGEELAPIARWHRHDGDWESPVELDPGQTTGCSDVDVSVNSGGDAVVAWHCGETAYLRQYRDGAWEENRQVLPDEVWGRIHVNMLDNGNVVGIHQTASADSVSCFSATEAGSFIVESQLREAGPDQSDTIEFGTVEFSLSEGGGGLAVWGIEDEVTSELSVAALRYNTDTNIWALPSVIPGSEIAERRHALEVAVSESGEAIVLWVEAVMPGQDDLKAAHFTLAGGWGMPETLDSLDFYVLNRPSIAALGDDDYLVAYTQKPTTKNVYTTFFRDGEWEAPGLFSDGQQDVGLPIVASDGRGNAFLVFAYDVDPNFTIDPVLLQMHRFSHRDQSWTDLSPEPSEPVYMGTMSLEASRAGYGALSWIGISGTEYTGTPSQRVDVSLKRFE